MLKNTTFSLDKDKSTTEVQIGDRVWSIMNWQTKGITEGRVTHIGLGGDGTTILRIGPGLDNVLFLGRTGFTTELDANAAAREAQKQEAVRLYKELRQVQSWTFGSPPLTEEQQEHKEKLIKAIAVYRFMEEHPDTSDDQRVETAELILKIQEAIARIGEPTET